MKMKRIMMCILLMFALCVPIVEPRIANQTAIVAQAKKYSVKKLRKKFKSLRKGVSQNFVARTIGKKLGMPIYDTMIDGMRWREYSVLFDTKDGHVVCMHFAFWEYALMKKTWQKW